MLRTWVSAFTLAAVLCPAGEVSLAADDPPQMEFFEKKIRPVLIQHCDKCHSGKSASLKDESPDAFATGVNTLLDSRRCLIRLAARFIRFLI